MKLTFPKSVLRLSNNKIITVKKYRYLTRFVGGYPYIKFNDKWRNYVCFNRNEGEILVDGEYFILQFMKYMVD